MQTARKPTRPLLALAIFIPLTATSARGARPPPYGRDSARTAVTEESPALPLALEWTWTSHSAPQLAWPGPAKWDGWHKIRGLKDRMTFDRALGVVAADDAVYIASSVDDRIRCLDAKSGDLRWSFTTEGPVRFAPTVAGDLVYAGSDDGHVYCLRASDGRLVWKQRPGPRDLRVPGNGRVISLWPVRTGVVVIDGEAYCCAGVFPWEGVHLAAYDARTGEPRWNRQMRDLPAQGYLLGSPTRLYVTTARDRPVVFDRRTGKRLYRVAGGGGGTYALITGDTLIYGPGKTGEISLHRPGQKDQLASFKGNHMIVTPKASYLATDADVTALDRGRYLWLSGQRRDRQRRKSEVGERLKKLDEAAKKLLKLKTMAQIAEEAARKAAEAKARNERENEGEDGDTGGDGNADANGDPSPAREPTAQKPADPSPKPPAVSIERLDERLAAIDTEKASLREELGVVHLDIDRLTGGMKSCFHWRVAHEHPFAMILAGATVFLGGRDRVVAIDAASGERVWSGEVDGDAYGLVVAGGRLLVSTDEGRVHCFFPSTAKNAGASEPAATPATEPTAKPGAPEATDPKIPAPAAGDPKAGDPKAGAPEVVVSTVHGPFTEFVTSDSVRFTWDTDAPTATILEIGQGDDTVARFGDTVPKTRHEVVVPSIARDTVYRYRVRGKLEDGRELTTPTYAFDSTFNYVPRRVEIGDWPRPSDRFDALYERTARRIVADAGTTTRGYCLVLDAREGRLAYWLARLTDWRIIAVERDAAHVEHARRNLEAAGVYGSRVTVHQQSGSELPYGEYLANVIVSDGMLHGGGLPLNAREVYRVLRPCGGLIHLAAWHEGDRAPPPRKVFDDWLLATGAAGGETRHSTDDSGCAWIHRRAPLEGARDWTHQYAGADNSSSSDDLLVGGKLRVAWFGRPGPRPMPDRGPRNPAPVSANGRLYVQGDRVLFGLDAYNGTVLWSRQIPTMRRANLPRSSSNMVATDDLVFVAVGDRCVGFDGQTGKRVINQSVAKTGENREYEWGYLSVTGDMLIGSATIRGGNYLGDNGEWYEDFKPEATAKVTSDRVFARDPRSGAEKWSYENGAIINSTITISDGVVYFVEGRDPAARDATSGRLTTEIDKNHHIVALHVDSGSVLWEMPFDLGKCQHMTYMSHRGDTLLVTGSDKNKKFHTWAFDTKDRKLRWEHHSSARKTHHSGHLMHPVIVGERVYLNKHTYDLRSGKVVKIDPFDYHGCGTMAASARAIFHRIEYHGMLDLESDKRTEFVGVRGSCWLGQIPAGGMLLAPESGAGCSCTHAFQTSMGFVPVSDEPAANHKTGDAPASPSTPR